MLAHQSDPSEALNPCGQKSQKAKWKATLTKQAWDDQLVAVKTQYAPLSSVVQVAATPAPQQPMYVVAGNRPD
jgi:hypothetical protein